MNVHDELDEPIMISKPLYVLTLALYSVFMLGFLQKPPNEKQQTLNLCFGSLPCMYLHCLYVVFHFSYVADSSVT